MSDFSDPLIGIIAVTPSDTVDILTAGTFKRINGIMVTVAGTVNAIFSDGTSGTFTALAGVLYPFAIKRVNATGTAATGIMVFI